MNLRKLLQKEVSVFTLNCPKPKDVLVEASPHSFLHGENQAEVDLKYGISSWNLNATPQEDASTLT